MTDPGDERHLPALAAALRALLVPGPGDGVCERVLAAYAEPAGLDFAAFLESTGAGFSPRGVWQRDRPSPRPEELRLPARWLDALAEGRCVGVPPGEPAPGELKALRLFGAPALLAAPARGRGLVGVVLLAAHGSRFTWSEGHEHAASSLAAALVAALVRADEASGVLDQLPQRIAWKDGALRYRGCNRAFARAAGLTSAQLAGRDDRELVLRPELGDRGDLARRREREVLASGRAQLARVEPTPLSAGREQWNLVSRVPLSEGTGRPQGLLVISEDISERMQASSALRHAERGAAVSRLAAAFAADLDPLLAEIAALGEGRPQALAREASDLVRQLGALARRQLADPVDVAPAVLISRMGRLLARILGEGVALDLPGEGLRCAVRVDPRQLEQLVVGLVRHARAHLAPGARLAVEVAPQTLGAERSLALGLPAGEYVRMSFVAGPIVQVPGDLSEGPQARLALAQAVARAAGGGLRVARDGAGLTLEVHLPRVFTLPRPAEANPALDLRGAESILVVDDDLPLRDAVTEALRQLGYAVHPVEDLTEALAAVRRLAAGPPALALVSAELPGGGPAELTRALRELQPDLRVLALTRQASGEGFFVASSFEVLAARVRQALDARSA